MMIAMPQERQEDLPAIDSVSSPPHCRCSSICSACGPLGALLNFVHALMQPIFLVSVVPISVAGWGVRESAMAFAYAGLMGSDGLIVAEAARYGFLSKWSLGRGNLE